MKIALLGGTGRVGREVAKLAEADGHTVVALVRDAEKGKTILPNAHLIEGDATTMESINQLVERADGLISCLGTDRTTTLTDTTPLLIRSMSEHGINRIVTIGTAGILNSRYEEDRYRFQSSESKRTKTFAAEEHLHAYFTLKESMLDWTIVCPTYLPEGGHEGNVRFLEDVLPENGERVTTYDTAKFAYDAFLEGTFSKKRVGICY
ncbi:hypothetical protein N781_14690 [Pontibacillus halophilus JSM 076056 = DSM 19796]|uniref:NAD(P)-binding domain-containing protein n=1 Tax=Pontibacillus halophilus JSM 076056 = DSM 19796 TaxID=1385510 RepID=A0A0A5GMX8_9BACI|nr:NAD(P)H-binding protein [Pontibacillus halophilus]KGX92578.1 hypothetical protein N781_14690 [Pontibacillus halophilus JSM 076056 = DSM 19796]